MCLFVKGKYKNFVRWSMNVTDSFSTNTVLQNVPLPKIVYLTFMLSIFLCTLDVIFECIG